MCDHGDRGLSEMATFLHYVATGMQSWDEHLPKNSTELFYLFSFVVYLFDFVCIWLMEKIVVTVFR